MSEWIKVDDKKPRAFVDVWLFNGKIYPGYKTSGGLFFAYGNLIEDVTHWMVMQFPERPKTNRRRLV